MWFVVLLALMLGYILGVIQHRPTGGTGYHAHDLLPPEEFDRLFNDKD